MYEPRRAPRHETLRLRGLDHHLTRWGPESAQPLVFLHGYLDVSDTFQFVVDAFENDWPIVAPDWRGFGRSAWTEQPYWFPDYLADLEALLDAVVAGPATLVGHSMGGNVAALYAGARPERVAGVVSLEGIGLPRHSAAEAPGRYRRWLDELKAPPAVGRYASLADFGERLARKNPRVRPDRAAFIASRWARAVGGGAVMVNADPTHRMVNPVLYHREDAEACWAACVAPCLLVLGGRTDFRGRLGPDGTDAHFASVFPRLEIRTLPEAGHMMHHEAPEAVARVIETFLKQLAREC